MNYGKKAAECCPTPLLNTHLLNYGFNDLHLILLIPHFQKTCLLLALGVVRITYSETPFLHTIRKKYDGHRKT